MAKKDILHRNKKENPALVKGRIEASLKSKLVETRNNAILTTVKQMSIMSAMILGDKFDFSIDQIKKFINCLGDSADAITDEYLTFQDMVNTLRDEKGLDFTDDQIIEIFPNMAMYLSDRNETQISPS